MSQYPPPPPHGNFPPQGFPPPQQGGYPPNMGGFGGVPGGPGGAYAMPAPRTSVSSIISLICGILSCIPLVNVLAVLFGIVGIAKTSKPNVTGRGLAIAGLILGLLGIGGWIAFVGVMYSAYNQGMAQLNAEGAPMVNAIAAGDFSVARKATTDDFSDAKFRALQEQIKPLGPFKSFDVQWKRGVETKVENGVQTMTLRGDVHFEKGTKPFTMILTEKNDVLKIKDFELK